MPKANNHKVSKNTKPSKKPNKPIKKPNKPSKNANKPSKNVKKTIPKAVREQCWISLFGKEFEHSCYISWCSNTINVFDFHVGHDTPESNGGTLDIDNIKPICARCNLSMSNNYTIAQWNIFNDGKPKRCCGCI